MDARANADMDRLVLEREEGERPAISFRPLGQFAAEYEPLSYVVDPIIRTGSLYTFTGKTGSGKTGLLVTASFAVASGNKSILGREVERGAVAYIALENPDDIRMRFLVTADRLGLSIDALSELILIRDRRAPPEEMAAELQALNRPFRLVILDTWAAAFDGKDSNDSVQAGEFTRRFRPLTQLPGRPAVILACHPVKNATAENLLPYGSGATLNEVDGNLTSWKEGDIVTLHWLGKLRGLEFDPAPFKFEPWESQAVLDAKGNPVRLPVCLPSTAEAVAERNQAAADRDFLVIRAIAANPKGTQRSWQEATGLSTGSLNRALDALERHKLIERGLDGRRRLTAKGKKEIGATSDADAVEQLSA